jgi:hypothetical protein
VADDAAGRPSRRVRLLTLGDYVPVIGDLLSRAGEFRAEQSSSDLRFVGPLVGIGVALGKNARASVGTTRRPTGL